MSGTIFEQIPTMHLSELYQLYVSTFFEDFEDDNELKDEYLKIRNGKDSPIGIEIDIYDIIEEEETQSGAIIVENQKKTVIYQGKRIDLYDYRTEKEKRKALLQIRLLREFAANNPFVSVLKK